MLNRFSMCGLIREPSPRMNRPFEYACRPPDVGDVHRIARERHGDARAELDMRGVLSGQHEGQKRVVVDFGCPAAVIAPSLERARGLGDVGELAGNGPVNPEAAAVTHKGERYSKQFSMVNVNMPVRRSRFDDGNRE
jgi:hypothetical protein